MTSARALPQQTQSGAEEEVEEGMVWSVSYKHPPSSEASSEWDGPVCIRDALSCNGPVQVRTVKAGRVENLVEYLAPYRTEVDVSYRTCFLATYRTFTTSGTILQLLRDRLTAMAALASDSTEEVREKSTVQSAIVSFLHIWLDTYPMDFYSPPLHSDLCTLELLSVEWAGLVGAVAAVRREIGRKTLSLDGDSLLSNISSSFWLGSGSQPFSLFSLSAQDLVHSLTAEDKYIFQSVLPHQCLTYIRAPRSAHAPTVRSAIHHFNRVSLVTMATVLQSGAGPEERGRVLGRWVEIAQHCRLVKNFSSLLAVLSGLQSSPVFRLRRAWDSVPREKVALLEELAQLFTAEDNFFQSRDLLCREGTSKHAEVFHRKKNRSAKALGVIPYLGTFLTDLTMTNTAFPDTLQGGLVNFEKRRREFELLAQLTLYQKSASAYAFPHNPQLVQWLRDTRVPSEQESHELSKGLEPESLAPRAAECSSHHATVRKTVRQLFRTAVGDSFNLARHSLFPDSPSHEQDHSDYVSQHGSPQRMRRQGDSSISPQRMRRQGDSSISPQRVRRQGESGHTVRVALEGSELCLYRTISITETDRVGTVVRAAMKKHGVEGDPRHFHLLLLNKQNESQQLPHDANLFYALSDSSVLVLTHEHQESAHCNSPL